MIECHIFDLTEVVSYMEYVVLTIYLTTVVQKIERIEGGIDSFF